MYSINSQIMLIVKFCSQNIYMIYDEDILQKKLFSFVYTFVFQFGQIVIWICFWFDKLNQFTNSEMAMLSS